MLTHRTNTTVKRIEEIYNENYWINRVGSLMQDKKNILKETHDRNLEIRKINDEN